jgi:hypothetical protein
LREKNNWLHQNKFSLAVSDEEIFYLSKSNTTFSARITTKICSVVREIMEQASKARPMREHYIVTAKI